MGLFTFVFEYKGGTYIDQKSADDVKSALINWAKDLNTSKIDGFNSAEKTELLNELNNLDSELVSLDGLVNTWCQDVFIGDKMYLINIIQTIS
jgi:hypothetical protein